MGKLTRQTGDPFGKASESVLPRRLVSDVLPLHVVHSLRTFKILCPLSIYKRFSEGLTPARHHTHAGITHNKNDECSYSLVHKKCWDQGRGMLIVALLLQWGKTLRIKAYQFFANRFFFFFFFFLLFFCLVTSH